MRGSPRPHFFLGDAITAKALGQVARQIANVVLAHVQVANLRVGLKETLADSLSSV